MTHSQNNTRSTLPTSSVKLLVGLWFKLWACLIIGIILPLTLTAQKINAIQYTVEDGLPSSNIYHVLQDREGYIWVTTDKGLAKFDGYTFQNFTIQDGLPSNDIWGIKEDKSGRLWLSTFNKVTYIQNNQIHTIPLQDTTRFSAPMMEEYWMAEKGDIYAMASDKYKNYFIQLNVEEGKQKVLKDNFGYTGYLGKIDDKKWFFNFPRSGGGPYISFIQEDSLKEEILLHLDLNPTIGISKKFVKQKDRIFFFSKDYLWHFYFSGLEKIPVADILGEGVVIEDVFPSSSVSQGLILIKTNKGFQILENLRPLNLLTNTNNFYKSIFEDRNKNIWLSATNGLFLITANARYSKYYPLSTNSSNNNCTALLIEEDQTIWAANQQNEIWKIQGEDATHVSLIQKDYTHIPMKHLLKWENRLIAAGDFGIFMLPPSTFSTASVVAQSFETLNRKPKIYDLLNGNFLPIPVKSVSVSGDDLLLSKWSGVTKLSRKGNWLYDLSILRGRTYISEQDDTGRTWLGRKNGLWYSEGKEMTQLGEKFPLLRQPINDLKLDQHNNIWIATDGFGLLFYNHEGVYEIKESKFSTPNRLFIDEHHQVWVATNRGISKIKINSYTPFSYEFTQLTSAHGLISNEVNQVVVKDSIVYAATNAGLTLIDHLRQQAPTPPILNINSIQANGEEVANDSLYEGDYQENNIKINYVCLSYKSRGAISYDYKMSGIDEEWQTTTSTSREYPQLQSGAYTFSLRAKDIDGVYSNERKIRFTIHPPWWETAWFRLLAIFCLIAIILGIIQLRVRSIRRQEKEKTRINQQFAELELQALRAQMNPHFIFNSMNAIQNYVYTKDKREAGKYIVQFSRLMRLFLNASHEKFIPLKQELEILERYVELEKMRFEDKFDYKFIIDKNLAIHKIAIPSLLLQPYVENAINHGLRHRKSKGHLWIRIYKGASSTFLCEIEDNGIGRVAAQKIKEKSVKKHQPRGMAIVAGRQRVLNNKSNFNVQIDIIDLYNEEREASGTKVVVQIPIGNTDLNLIQ